MNFTIYFFKYDRFLRTFEDKARYILINWSDYYAYNNGWYFFLLF